MFDTIIREAASRFGLGDKGGMLVQMLLAYMTNKDTGGLSGFIDKFKSAGLGSMIGSWMGGGSGAQSITPSQIEQVLGGSGGLIGTLTSKLGIGAPTAASALSFLLPTVLGKLTPGGSIPTSLPTDVLGYISGAKSLLSGGATAAAGATQAAGNGLMKWLPWVAAAIAALFLLNYCSKPSVDATKAAAAAATATADAAKTAATAAANAAADAAKATAAAAADAAKLAAAAIPVGAGSIAAMFEGAPSLKVYFDTGKTDLSADFGDKLKPLVDHLKANAGMKAVVSGFNDPTGNAAANAELSKKRAQAVAAGLKAAGVADDRVSLEKPANPTAGSTSSNAEARRVEVTLRK